MFWEIFYMLCEKNNLKPITVVKNLNIAAGSITKWKNGSIPNGETLIKLADYFNCSIDYLLGRTDVPEVNRRSSAPITELAFQTAAVGEGVKTQTTTLTEEEIKKLKQLIKERSE